MGLAWMDRGCNSDDNHDDPDAERWILIQSGFSNEKEQKTHKGEKIQYNPDHHGNPGYSYFTCLLFCCIE